MMPFEQMERTISIDGKGVFTLISLASTIGIYVNSTRLSSLYVGVILSIIYFLINSIFTGNIFFRDERVNFRFIFGLFLLLMLIATGGAAIIISSALVPIRFDATATTALLALLTAAISLLNHTKIMTKLLKEK